LNCNMTRCWRKGLLPIRRNDSQILNGDSTTGFRAVHRNPGDCKPSGVLHSQHLRCLWERQRCGLHRRDRQVCTRIREVSYRLAHIAIIHVIGQAVPHPTYARTARNAAAGRAEADILQVQRPMLDHQCARASSPASHLCGQFRVKPRAGIGGGQWKLKSDTA